ncbi:hypothetical protein HON22_01460, partial [Candidatus Peregrinibacteria bacterium]|nr:hypothetical protein [Candidatus Peregrinibacteria bacterium]
MHDFDPKGCQHFNDRKEAYTSSDTNLQKQVVNSCRKTLFDQKNEISNYVCEVCNYLLTQITHTETPGLFPTEDHTFADPKNDLAFKKIFGNEQYPEIIMSFLNEVLALSESNKIESIEFLDKEQVPLIQGLKNSLLDIRVRDFNKN